MTTLNVSPNCLLVYVDETGHEEFRDPHYQIFGMGGCAVLAQLYLHHVDEPWREMKANYFAGLKIPLHACELRNPTQAQVKALGAFFCNGRFSRFAAVARMNTKIPKEITPHQLIAGTLMERVKEIAAAYQFDSVALIFESSSRSKRLIKQHFGSLGLIRKNGTPVTMHHAFMPKSCSESGLEVADFIIHAAGGKVWHHMKTGMNVQRRDFDCVFKNVSKSLVSYIEIDTAGKLRSVKQRNS